MAGADRYDAVLCLALAPLQLALHGFPDEVRALFALVQHPVDAVKRAPRKPGGGLFFVDLLASHGMGIEPNRWTMTDSASSKSPLVIRGQNTPLPWRVDEAGIRAMVRGGDATIVALRHRLPCETHEANLALIVRAVNNHDALVEALRAMVEDSDVGENCSWEQAERCERAWRLAYAALERLNTSGEPQQDEAVIVHEPSANSLRTLPTSSSLATSPMNKQTNGTTTKQTSGITENKTGH